MTADLKKPSFEEKGMAWCYIYDGNGLSKRKRRRGKRETDRGLERGERGEYYRVSG